jgi:hypothetical protein
MNSRSPRAGTGAAHVVPTPGERLARRVAAAGLLLVGGAIVHGTDALACDDHHHGKAAQKALALSDTFGTLTSHAAIGEKGNGSGVTFGARVAKNIAVGVASPLTLEFGPARAEGARARLRAPEGVTLTLADGSPVGDIALALDKPTQLELLVTATRDGRQYLDVTTTQNGRASVRSVALPVGSNEARMKSVGRLETRPDGSRVRVMQAQ